MTKKALNIIELLTIVILCWAVIGFYQTSNSVNRFHWRNELFDPLRVLLDLMILTAFVYRAIAIIKSYSLSWNDLNRNWMVALVMYTLYIIAILPDLHVWIQWQFFAGFYGHTAVLYLTPVLFWIIEWVESRQNKSIVKKVGKYAIAILCLSSVFLLHRHYLNGLKRSFEQNDIETLERKDDLTKKNTLTSKTN